MNSYSPQAQEIIQILINKMVVGQNQCRCVMRGMSMELTDSEPEMKKKSQCECLILIRLYEKRFFLTVAVHISEYPHHGF